MENFTPNTLEGGNSKKYTLDEFIDLVDSELTMDCTLPQVLNPRTIKRLITTEAQPWFYQNYPYAVQRAYYYVPRNYMETEEFTRYKYITLPEQIQTVTWVFKVDNRSLYQLGINAPNLSINLGVTNQPFLSSYVTTIGELGLYKTVLDSFSDMLNQMNLFTVQYDYNQMSNRLNILSNIRDNLILECYVNIEDEALYSDPLFLKYVQGIAKLKMSEVLGRFDFNLPGDIKYNPEKIESEGQKSIDFVMEQIKRIPNTGFFYMVNR